MRKVIFALVATVLMGATAVQAGDCPNIAAQVAEMIAAMPDADAAMLEQAQALHDEGMMLHESGDHAGSVAKLEEAVALLEVK